jgi:hypothetical protein
MQDFASMDTVVSLAGCASWPKGIRPPQARLVVSAMLSVPWSAESWMEAGISGVDLLPACTMMPSCYAAVLQRHLHPTTSETKERYKQHVHCEQ